MCQQTKQMTFWEIGVGLWSTAHFVYNSGGFRGGAWEAWAPPLSQVITNNILKIFTCLEALVRNPLVQRIRSKNLQNKKQERK